MKIPFSVATLVLAVASVVIAVPTPSRAAPIEDGDAQSAPPEMIKFLKEVGWLSANYSAHQKGPSNPSLNPPPRNGGSTKNSTQTIEKRAASSCNSISLYWYVRHPEWLRDELDKAEEAEHMFRLEVSPNKYTDKMYGARSQGAPPEFLETRLSYDGKWGVTHDRNYRTGKVSLVTNGQQRVYNLGGKFYEDYEEGYVIFSIAMYDCIQWFN
ncbi:hypothetical protein BG015_000627 [Linnemannia schmuckeri]|uniref:Uncharacterized protein n=1 Tax=Linnemannia schmuckeri TaxID=64567 RepID=A0A9P5VE58_9FUNG|nr:hypothetical protein BG015_000627 [Linnemannia schmuckeri]